MSRRRKSKRLIAAAAVAMLLILTMTATVLAAPSKQGDITLDSDKQFTISDVTDGWTPLSAEQAAAMIGGGIKPSELTILWQKVVEAEDLPINISFTYDALQQNQRLYIFHNSWKADGSGKDVWDMVVAQGENGAKTVQAAFERLSPVAVVVYTPSGSSAADPSGNGAKKSPKTGGAEGAIPFACAAGLLAGGLLIGGTIKRKYQ